MNDFRVVGIHPIYRSGSVRRWHANPDVPGQTLADHQGRVAQIIFFFWPDASAELIYAALHHDCGELYVGDLPGPIKEMNPTLAAIASQAETQSRAKMGIHTIDARHPHLRFADHLEAVTQGQIKKLLITVPPGSMKSLLTRAFWPTWSWISNPPLRYIGASYAEALANAGKVTDLSVEAIDRFYAKEAAAENKESNHG